MPELPEVETVRRGLEPVMQGQRIERCILNRADLRFPFHPEMKDICSNVEVKSLIRRGKYMILHLENDFSLIWHLGMSGSARIYKGHEKYDPQSHDHVIFEMRSGACIVFNDPRRFGFMQLVDTKSWENQPPFSVMGPEPLSNDFSAPVLYERLKTRKAPMKAALLDQNVVAGLGNIYVCEALFMSGISPKRKANAISLKKCELLVTAIRTVLNSALQSGGSSLRDHKQTDGSLGYFQHMFSVYDREGKPCPDCDCDLSKTGGVRRIIQSGRSTFYCPRFQK